MKFAEPLHPDRLHVDIEKADELHALAKHLGVTPEEIIGAVGKGGNSVATVRKELGISEDKASVRRA
jgi:predicted RNA-binding protein YlqC (UPF0109 family)